MDDTRRMRSAATVDLRKHLESRVQKRRLGAPVAKSRDSFVAKTSGPILAGSTDTGETPGPIPAGYTETGETSGPILAGYTDTGETSGPILAGYTETGETSDVAPWGFPPTPVLPRWFVEKLAEKPLPAAVANRSRGIEKFADLPFFWEQVTEPLSKSARRALVVDAANVAGFKRIVAVPAEMPMDRILALPLRTRTMNALRRVSRFFEPDEPVTAAQLLGIANFGMTSLIDLLCVLEAADRWLSTPPNAGTGGEQATADSSGVLPPAGDLPDEFPDALSGSWRDAHGFVDIFLPVLSVARDLLGCRTVAEALASPRLVELLEKTGAVAALERLGLDGLPGDVGPIAGLVDAVRHVEGENGPDNVDIVLRHKVLKTASLASLGEQRGITRERVRQLEVKVLGALDEHAGPHAGVIASLVAGELPVIVGNDLVNERIDAVVRSAEAAHGDGLEPSTKALCEYLIRSELGYTTKGSLALGEDGRLLVDDLAQRIVSEADDVGLVDLEAILAQEAPHAMEFVEELVELLGLSRIGNRLALRDTQRARAKLAILEIGRPATKEEIAEQGGLGDRVATTLSNIDSIARADKHRWGLIEWIDDVYEGIPAEICQRIDAHGGVVPLSFLLEDIPERFAVSKSSVRAYVGSKQFDLLDGMVSLASPGNISYRPLDDVATRNEHGELCWDFPVEARYFDGYSIQGFPPELARELGCGPNDRRRVPVASPDGCDPVSINWRLTSPSGAAEIGRVGEPLREIDAVAGESARLVIVDGGYEVVFESIPQEGPVAEPSTAEGLLERIKSRRRIG